MALKKIEIKNYTIKCYIEKTDNSRPNGMKKQPYSLKMFKDDSKIKSCNNKSISELNKGVRLATAIIEKCLINE